MVKEIPVSKTLLEALNASLQAVSSLFEKNLPNERQILQNKIFELKNLSRELIDVARLRHPELLGVKATSQSVNLELNELELLKSQKQAEFNNATDINTRLRINGDLARIEVKVIKLTDKLKRLLEIEKANPGFSVEEREE